MKRHDYERTLFSQFTGEWTGRFAVLRLRLALATGALILLVAAATYGIEAQRIGTLDRDYAALTERIQLTAGDARRSQSLANRIRHDDVLLERIGAARRAATVSSNAVAAIGNALPAQTWLTNLTAAPAGTWTIAGRSTRVAEVGTTLRAIARLDDRAAARLVSIAASGRSGAILDFVIAWDREP